MDHTETYTALDAMIRQGWWQLDLTEIKKHLDLLKEQKLITAKEYEALLALAEQVKTTLFH